MFRTKKGGCLNLLRYSMQLYKPLSTSIHSLIYNFFFFKFITIEDLSRISSILNWNGNIAHWKGQQGRKVTQDFCLWQNNNIKKSKKGNKTA